MGRAADRAQQSDVEGVCALPRRELGAVGEPRRDDGVTQRLVEREAVAGIGRKRQGSKRLGEPNGCDGAGHGRSVVVPPALTLRPIRAE
jgi:hypothetical protein